MLLQILYKNIGYKHRILTKQRVKRVDLRTDGVRVHTEEGSTFTGDMVVGADGVHSVIRKEMWRIGKEVSPGYFPDNETSRWSCHPPNCLVLTT